MPLAPVELIKIFEDRLQGFWDLWGKIKILEQETKINDLIVANQTLENEVARLNGVIAISFGSNSSSTGITRGEFDILRAEFEAWKNSSVAHKGSGGQVDEEKYNLKSQFKTFETSDLVVDWDQEEMDSETLGSILNVVFAKLLKPGSKVVENFKFDRSIINRDLSLKQWIEAPTGVFNDDAFKTPEGKWLTGYPKSNVFNTANPEYLEPEMDSQGRRKPARFASVDLGTGKGKSTFFLVCLGFRRWTIDYIKAHLELLDQGKLGASLMVPYDSLVPALIKSHNDWLSQLDKALKRVDAQKLAGEKIDYSVVRCPICYDPNNTDIGQHVGYQMIHNGEAELLNIFSPWELMAAFVEKKLGKDGKPIIKDPLVIDEAHIEDPAYQAVISFLEGKTYEPFDAAKLSSDRYNKRWFNIVKMSATFNYLPISRKLSGDIEDIYANDFKLLIKRFPAFFKGVVLVFCDKPKEVIDFKQLRDKGIKYVDLTDPDLKNDAVAIVQSIKGQFLAFVDENYETGISFGIPKLNVISTGRSVRKKRKTERDFEDVVADSPNSSLCQGRGRASRYDWYPKAIWVCLTPEAGTFKGKGLEKDWVAEKINIYSKQSPPVIDQVKKDFLQALKIYATPPAQPKLTPEELNAKKKDGRRNLYLVLVKELTSQLQNPEKLFTLLTSEKKSELMKNSKKKKLVEEGKIGRDKGEFILTSSLVKYLDPNDLSKLLILATQPIIEQLKTVGNYPWVETEELDDDFIFPLSRQKELLTFAFLFQARLPDVGHTLKTNLTRLNDQEEEVPAISITFKPYQFENHKKVLTGEEKPLVEKHW